MKKEIQYKIKQLKEKIVLNTIYIGGGTPSYIDDKYICEILGIEEIAKNLKNDVEITIEVNPGTINENRLLNYKYAGINRISMGLQTTDDELLKKVGRIHNYQEFLRGYNIARELGFKNINIDLMLALPGQNLKMLTNSVNEIIKLNPEHISIYSLILEENTKLYNMANNKKVQLPKDEEEREMYWEAKRILEEHGYKHYEISNFSKMGFESRHNMNCWEQSEYLGFGVASHSYYNDIRYSNVENIEEYIKNIQEDKMKDNITVHEIQKTFDKEKEYIMLGLRKINGINLNEFKRKFGKDILTVFCEEIDILQRQKLITIKDNRMYLSNNGIDYANIVWEKFV